MLGHDNDRPRDIPATPIQRRTPAKTRRRPICSCDDRGFHFACIEVGVMCEVCKGFYHGNTVEVHRIYHPSTLVEGKIVAGIESSVLYNDFLNGARPKPLSVMA